MTHENAAAGRSNVLVWVGRIMSFVPATMLLLDAVMKLVKPEPVVKATIESGYPESIIVGLGVVLLVSVVLYLIPRTAVLGAILLTGYLGGAVATHVQLEDGWFFTIFPALFGAVLWGGLVLRDERLRSLLPIRTASTSSFTDRSEPGERMSNSTKPTTVVL